jgi:hypothetical protein
MNIELGKAKGVRFDVKRNRWCASIKHNGKIIYVGQYVNKNDAILQRELKIKELGIDVVRHDAVVQRMEFERRVCKMYLDGMTQSDIGESVGRNSSVICEILQKHSVKIREKKIHTNDAQIVKLYEKGMTALEISELLDVKVNQQTVANRLRERGVILRHRKYNFDTTMFRAVDTETKSYFLGLLYADGGVGKSNVILGLHEKDRSVLLELSVRIFGKDVLKFVPGFTVTKKNGKTYTCSPKYSLILNSKELVADLFTLGCTRRKSLTLQFPTDLMVPSKFMPHFLRGYFDGDGWISPSRKSSTTTFGIISSNDFCRGLQRFLSDALQINASIRPAGKVSRLTFSRREDIRKIYDYMYKDSTICMSRKRSVFEDRLR